jgi:hypothetical protein
MLSSKEFLHFFSSPCHEALLNSVEGNQLNMRDQNCQIPGDGSFCSNYL